MEEHIIDGEYMCRKCAGPLLNQAERAVKVCTRCIYSAREPMTQPSYGSKITAPEVLPYELD